MKPYISIDIETTGLDPDNNNMILEVGAVIDDWESDIEDLPTFRCFVDNGPVLKGNAYALSMHPHVLRYIATRGEEAGEEVREELSVEGNPIPVNIIEVDQVAGHFLEWLLYNKINPYERHLTVAGKNFAGFDRPFLEKLNCWKSWVKTQHRVIDPGNLYWDPKVDSKGLPDLRTCMERAGISGEVPHNAVDDAVIVVKLVRHWYGNAFIRGPFWKDRFWKGGEE